MTLAADALVGRIAAAAAAAEDPRAFIEWAGAQLRQHFGADQIVLCAVDGDGRRLRQVPPPGGALSCPSGLAGPALDALLALDRPTWVDDAVVRGLVAASPAALAVPLRHVGRMAGVALLAFPRERSIAPDAAQALVSVGAVLGGVLANEEADDQLAARLEDLALVHGVGMEMATLALGGPLEAALLRVVRTLAADTGEVYLTGPRGPRRVASVGAGVGAEADRDDPESRAIARQVSQSARTQSGHRAAGGARCELLASPLQGREGTLGALVLGRCRPMPFDDRDGALIALVAAQIGVALENAELYESVASSFAELRDTQRRLVEKERLAMIGELAATVTHEIRNPLGAMSNALALLRGHPASASQQPLLQVLDQETTHLQDIANALLDLARPPRLQTHALDLARLVDEALRVAQDTAPRGAPIQVQCQLDAQPIVGDGRQLRQALLNLFSNALYAMPQGGTLTVECGPGMRGDEICLRITDTGDGIRPEHRALIFEPFFTTRASGTGLGLSVVRRIVEAHGGRIFAQSEPGCGTTFVVSLPCATVEIPSVVH